LLYTKHVLFISSSIDGQQHMLTTNTNFASRLNNKHLTFIVIADGE